jgi:hypothetical protein
MVNNTIVGVLRQDGTRIDVPDASGVLKPVMLRLGHNLLGAPSWNVEGECQVLIDAAALEPVAPPPVATTVLIEGGGIVTEVPAQKIVLSTGLLATYDTPTQTATITIDDSLIVSPPSWHTLLDVDYTAQTTQTFTGDGPVTIAGQTYVVANWAHIYVDPPYWLADMGIVSGSGLKMGRNDMTGVTWGSRTFPCIGWKFPDTLNNLSPVRVACKMSLPRVYQWNAIIMTVDYQASGDSTHRAGTGIVRTLRSSATDQTISSARVIRTTTTAHSDARSIEGDVSVGTTAESDADVIGLYFPDGVGATVLAYGTVGLVSDGDWDDLSRMRRRFAFPVQAPSTADVDTLATEVGQASNWGVTLMGNQGAGGAGYVTALKVEAFY